MSELLPQELTLYKNSSYVIPCTIEGCTLVSDNFTVVLIIKERDTYREAVLVKSTATATEGIVIDDSHAEFYIDEDDFDECKPGVYVVGLTIKNVTIVQPVAKASLLLIQPVEEPEVPV